MPPQRRQQHVDQTHTYIRMFCGSLCGFSLLVLICMSPLNWVQFLVINDGLELYAGLWIPCNHELCWSHTPKPPCECHWIECCRPHSSRIFCHIGSSSFFLQDLLTFTSLSPEGISAGLWTWTSFSLISSVYPFSFIPQVISSSKLWADSLFLSVKNLFVIYELFLWCNEIVSLMWFAEIGVLDHNWKIQQSVSASVSFNFQGQFVLLTVEEKLNACQICSITNARYLENKLSNLCEFK